MLRAAAADPASGIPPPRDAVPSVLRKKAPTGPRAGRGRLACGRSGGSERRSLAAVSAPRPGRGRALAGRQRLQWRPLDRPSIRCSWRSRPQQDLPLPALSGRAWIVARGEVRRRSVLEPRAEEGVDVRDAPRDALRRAGGSRRHPALRAPRRGTSCRRQSRRTRSARRSSRRAKRAAVRSSTVRMKRK